MNIKHMEYFIVLAKEKSFSKASQVLGITQPTLSQSVQKMETVLGAALFDRSFATLTLTKEGEIFLRACKKTCDIYNRTISEIADMNNGLNGKVRLGIAPFRVQYVLPKITKEFLQRYPHTVLEVEELIYDDMMRELETGGLDLVVTAYDGKAGMKFTSVPIGREEVLVAVHKNLVAKNKKLKEYALSEEIQKVSFSSFADTKFIMLGDDQMLCRQLKSLAEKSGITLQTAVRCNTVDTSVSLANNSVGAALVLSTGLEYYSGMFPDLRFFSISTGNTERTVSIIYRKNQYLSNPVKAVIDILTKGNEK